MPKRGLVLGGGGAVGVAWEYGLVSGLRLGGVDLTQADVFIGTSAGSVVSSNLASGKDPNAMIDLVSQPEGKRPALQVDQAAFRAIFKKSGAAQTVDAALLAEIGAMAVDAPTMPESTWLEYCGTRTGGDWPERTLRITTVEAQTGRFTVWDRTGGIPLWLAVAASCSVPGLVPLVTIQGRRYMDGGMRSGTSADLALDCDSVVVIAPVGPSASGIGASSARKLAAEVAFLETAGKAVQVIYPDDEALEAFGKNYLDPARSAPAAATGIRQGQALAARLIDRAIWQ